MGSKSLFEKFLCGQSLSERGMAKAPEAAVSQEIRRWKVTLAITGAAGRRPEEACRTDSWLWAICIVLCSALDAFLTLHHIQGGGSELNPFMALLLDQGSPAFVGIKMALTIGGVLVLTRYRSIGLAFHALRGCAVLYLGILAYHGILLWSV